MNPLIVVLYIKSELDRRGKPHSTVEAMTEDPNHDVRIVAVGFVHGPHGTIGADLAVKVTPKANLTPSPHRVPRTREPSHPRSRKPWNTTARVSKDNT
jgi:hypothetical protein